MPQRLYIGLMSGTSLDGVDGVLADMAATPPRLLAAASVPMPAALRQDFLALNTSGPDELNRAALAGNALAACYAETVEILLSQTGVARATILAIGAHGQTIRHEPAAGYTLQVNAPALLAELTGIAVISDFRSRDVAAGGQGAPLVPAFHAAIFGNAQPRAVLNLGGIANLTLLQPGEPVRGFDTGPANMLLDAWIRDRRGCAFDAQGQWAASGTVDQALLAYLCDSEPWFRLPPPKSTGRDRFGLPWLLDRLHSYPGGTVTDQDIQATLQALTARTVADALQAAAPEVSEVIACGGGIFNPGLLAMLAQHLPCPLTTSGMHGVPEQQMEALAFAWLAHAHDQGTPAGLPSVTGARGARVLGGRYPA